MSNGAAIAHLPLPQAPTTSTKAFAGDTNAVPVTAIEAEIGLAVADAACAIAASIEDFRCGGAMTTAVRDIGAVRIAKVAELALDHELGDADFLHAARVAGRHVLQRRLADDDFFLGQSPAGADAAIDILVDHLFTIVERVVHDERVFRAAWAN